MTDLFRNKYRELTDAEKERIARVKTAAAALAQEIDTTRLQKLDGDVPPRGTPEALLVGIDTNIGAHVVLAIRHVEDAVYRAVKAVTG